jgi:hypothetical protein
MLIVKEIYEIVLEKNVADCIEFEQVGKITATNFNIY